MCFCLLHAHYIQSLQKKQTNMPVFNEVVMDVEILETDKH